MEDRQNSLTDSAAISIFNSVRKLTIGISLQKQELIKLFLAALLLNLSDIVVGE